ncbi:MAG: dihydroorotate dehydrogenase electron transfer subunit [Spirochaetaceae bacterium]|jgi:dihydroorotate dehydrogenase electron transfer subunit|nr:dihydroorotate dehydrogenase electron transfer subunit [Spirochaetaceae bacterium]
MAEVLSNENIASDFWLLKVREKSARRPAMGQFYMIRAWDAGPLLSRPVSVFDSGEDTVSFLYRVMGRGTKIISELKAGDSLTLLGPLGRGFSTVSGRTALVGGGAGIAPLYFAARTIRLSGAATTLDIFLGFSGVPVLEESYRLLCDNLVVQSGGFITGAVKAEDYDCMLACGPEPMMKALSEKCRGLPVRLELSLESRMACGVGACLVCSRGTAGGNKKVCKDGPVFAAGEIYGP